MELVNPQHQVFILILFF